MSNFFLKKLRKASLGENERLRGETALIRGATPPGWGESSTISGETFPILGERVRNKRTRTVKNEQKLQNSKLALIQIGTAVIKNRNLRPDFINQIRRYLSRKNFFFGN